ncbi:MAG: hypothetical protein E7311_02415 [Clostridiales bacterium]|nr:hypothetical protein [Clostridiales bacterium]
MENWKEKDALMEKSIIEIYEMVLKGIIKCFPSGFWDEKVAKTIIKYVYKDYSRKQLLQIDFKTELKERRLSSAFKVFNYSTFKLLTFCFPELQIKPWELKVVPNGCWKNKDNVKDAVKNAFKKARIKEKDKICLAFSADFLRKYGLKSLLEEYTLYEILEIAFPEYDFVESDLNKQYKWEKETAIKNIKHLIENVLNWDYKAVCDNISTNVFYENGLSGLLTKVCHNSVYEALELAYPGKYQKKDLKSYSIKYNFGRDEAPIS